MAKKYPELASILKKLLFKHDIKPIDLARAVDLPPPTIHRLVTGKSTRPYKSSLKPIADYFLITVEQLLGEEPLQEAYDFTPLPSKNQKTIEIPLLEWKNLSQLTRLQQSPEQTIAAMDDLSSKCFAVKMNDSSMEPQFSKGSTLIFDPNKEASDRSYILLKLKESEIFIFRQLIIDADHHFIRPLAPDLMSSQMRLLDDTDVITAVLVEARLSYTHF